MTAIPVLQATIAFSALIAYIVGMLFYIFLGDNLKMFTAGFASAVVALVLASNIVFGYVNSIVS